MTIPTIHLNGTSADSLISALSDAYDALNTAYDALRQCAPNGRDYYPQGPHAINVATAEHFGRLRRIQDTQAELVRLIEGIEEQTRKI